MEGVSLQDIAKTQATPFYVYSQSKIINNFQQLERVFGSEIFYAVKAALSPNFSIFWLTLSFFLLRDFVLKIILQHVHLISSVSSHTSHQLHRFSPN